MKKKAIPFITIFILAAIGALWLFGGFAASGLTPPKAAEISNSSIIIGTYLIDFAVLNEENQELAQDNAAQTSQSKVYYKSDINRGVWYDISDAENVGDISLNNSKIVSNSVIDAIKITMYFKADGTIIDYSTGKTTTAQDILTTVYPANMSELGGLVQQRGILESLVDSEEDDDKWDIYNDELKQVSSVLAAIDDDTVRGFAKELTALDKNIKSLKSQQAVDAVVTVKLKKEAERDIYCCNVVVDRLNSGTETLAKYNMTAHSELISQMNDAITALNGTISELEAEAGGGSSSSDEAKDRLADEMVEAAVAGDVSALNKAAEKLQLLEALINGEECDDLAAAELLEETLTELEKSITEEVNSILNSTHEFYSADNNGTLTADSVVAAVNQKIGDAQGYIEDIAERLTGDSESSEANKLKAEKLGILGASLETLSENTATDTLQEKLISVLSQKSAEVLDSAAQASALSVSSLAGELSGIDALEAAADAKYEEYIEALEKGDAALAASLKKELNELNDALDNARGASDIAGLYSAVIDAKLAVAASPSDKAAAQQLRDAKAALSAAEKTLSASDAILLGELDTALAELEDACSSGSGETAKQCLGALTDAMGNLDVQLIPDEVKSKVLKLSASILEDAANTGSKNGDAYNANMLLSLAENAADMSTQALMGTLAADGSQTAQAKAVSGLVNARGKAADAKAKVEKATERMSNLNLLLSVETAKLDDGQKALKDNVSECIDRIEAGARGLNAKVVNSACNELSALLSAADFEVFDSGARESLAEYATKLLDEASSASSSPAAFDSARKALTSINLGDNQAQSAVGEILSAMFDEKGVLHDAEQENEQAQNALDEAKSAASGIGGLMPVSNALEALEGALAALNVNSAEAAYSDLLQKLDALPSGVIDAATKNEVIDYAQKLVSDAADTCRQNGDSKTAEALENAVKEVTASSSEETGDYTDIIGEELYAYKLVATELGIYSNSMTMTVGKTTYIKILDAARAAGSTIITADNVYVIKDENILIEFELSSTRAFVGDKLFALSEAPFAAEDAIYAPVELFAKGYSLSVEEENGTIFLRKEQA